ncbi:hypothetical protein BC826DRAFT_1054662, partial [Russula brevipes]
YPPSQVAKRVKFTRSTICTMYRIITGHTFTGAYTQRFYPNHSLEQIACQCGKLIQTIEHVLMACPLYTEARHKHLTAVLCFLEETGACAKPRAVWNPG